MTSKSFKEQPLYNKDLYNGWLGHYQIKKCNHSLKSLYNQYYALQEYITEREICELMCGESED